MNIVGIVAERIHALRAALRDVLFVGRDRLLVRGDDVVVAADAQVDVRGHVDDVSRARHQRQQPVRFALGALRRFVGSHR